MKLRSVVFAAALAAVSLTCLPLTALAGMGECSGPEQCDDGNSCTTDSCVATECVNDPLPNVASPCSAQVGCSIGVCDAGGNCIQADAPDDTPCPDSAFCNGVETCQGGVCTSAAPACDDEIACTLDSCNEAADSCTNAPQDVACNDGLACNGVETCNAVSGCQAGTPIDCGDGVGCTTDTCDEATDSCVNTANDANCNDGQFCNGTETCHATQGCQEGVAPCTDAVACTIDACNEILDTCSNTPSDLACEDGDFCNGLETCDAVFGCSLGENPCDDDVTCTTDTCIELTDTCLNTPVDSACDDQTFCNGVEVCNAQTGCESGTPETCNDGVTCTTDSCNTGTDSCDNTPVAAACDDGLFCNGEEVCDAGSGCVDAGEGPCGDAVSCTTDSCDEDTDSCANVPDDSACTDQLFCNGEEVCDANSGCVDAEDPCVDTVSCTIDGCEEVTDTCTNIPSDLLCDDLQFCTGNETCDQLQGCLPGAPVDCSDGIDCTEDICNDVTDLCENPPDNTVCDDDDVCNGEEFCDAGTGCVDGSPLVCDDDQFCNGEETCDASTGCVDAADPCDDEVACTVDSCDEKTDTCTGNTPSNALCDNQTFCDGEEVCDANSGCLDGDDPCDDGIGCTSDACTEALDLCTNVPVPSECDDDDPCTVDTCSTNLDCQNVALPDFDDDGRCDAADNCPLERNPDQLNSDCDDEDFQEGGNCADVEFNPLTDANRGCCDGGDVCDACPARTINEDGTEQCNPERSGGITCTPAEGCTLTTEDGCITIVVPAGALTEERSISVTDAIDEEQNLLARDALLYQVGLRPLFVDFEEPVSVTLCWDDRDDDDHADEGICGAGPGLGLTCDADADCGVGGECDRPSTTREETLVMKRDSQPFSSQGIFEPPYTCEAHSLADAGTNQCDTVEPDCDGEDSDAHTVAGCCDTEQNTWELRTCSFGQQFLGEFPGDLIPGNGSRQTDCVTEWNVANPHNVPYRDDLGFPSNEQTCRDGDPLCDQDGVANGTCVFRVGVCFNVLDRRLTDANDNRLCTPTDVTEWNVEASGAGDDAGDLAAEVAALGNGTAEGDSVTFAEPLDDRDECSRLTDVEVSLDQIEMLAVAAGSASGAPQADQATKILRMAASRSDSTDEPDIGADTTTTTTMLENGPKCGDSDDDGTVDATDALIALRTAVGTSTCDPTLCDVTTDGRITASDALAILKTAVGQELEVACGLGALPSDRDRLRLTCTRAEDQID